VGNTEWRSATRLTSRNSSACCTALGLGNNSRMSSKERTTDKKIDRLDTVKFLYDQRITANWMSNWFMNLHLQPFGRETTPEAKRPKTALGPGSWDRSSRGGGGGGGGGGKCEHSPRWPKGSKTMVEPVCRPHGKGVAHDNAPEQAGDVAGPVWLPKPVPTLVSPETPVSAANGIWSTKEKRVYTPGIVREFGNVGFVFVPSRLPFEPRLRAARRAWGPRDSRGSVTYCDPR
jgi:hypothetical protein